MECKDETSGNVNGKQLQKEQSKQQDIEKKMEEQTQKPEKTSPKLNPRAGLKLAKTNGASKRRVYKVVLTGGKCVHIPNSILFK